METAAIIKPAIETLFSLHRADSLWPREIRENRELMRQIEEREKLLGCMRNLFEEVSEATMDIAQATELGIAEAGDLSTMYELLANFLDSDENHARLILYLPFEILCARTWQPRDEKLAEAITRFSSVYLKRWRELLMSGNDVQANFVDGDILEEGLSREPSPLVRKVAHLIPVLVGKGFISASEMVTILHDNADPVLRASIFDTLPVLADLSLLPLTEWRRLFFSGDGELRRMAFSVARRLADEGDLNTECNTTEHSDLRMGAGTDTKSWLRSIALHMAYECKDIEDHFNSAECKKMPLARVNWERKTRKEAVIAKYARLLADALVNQTLLVDDLFKFVTSQNSPAFMFAGIKGLGGAVETLARKNLEKARKLQQESDHILRGFWQGNNADIGDILTSIWARWAGLGVVDRSHLKEYGIELPKFDSSNAVREMSMVEKDIEELTPVFNAIRSDPEISRFLYPIIVLFGSRIKGYATSRADLDAAIFIRPEISEEERPRLHALLAHIFSGETKIGEKVVEFWLTNEESKIRIRDLATSDVTVADSTWVHVLLEGIWCGEKESMQGLYEKLLAEYLFSQGKKIEGRDARKIWLEEMEREVLQYRLMHNGYHRYFPEQGGISTRHAAGIDSQSAFWDSGYRRVATILFLKRVFLPQLERRVV